MVVAVATFIPLQSPSLNTSVRRMAGPRIHRKLQRADTFSEHLCRLMVEPVEDHTFFMLDGSGHNVTRNTWAERDGTPVDAGAHLRDRRPVVAGDFPGRRRTGPRNRAVDRLVRTPN